MFFTGHGFFDVFLQAPPRIRLEEGTNNKGEGGLPMKIGTNKAVCAMLLCIGLLLTAVPNPGSAQLSEEPAKAPAHSKMKNLALIIDDFGNDMAGTREMFELPITFTAAVMPFLPTTKRDAEWAHKTGNEVIVHLPMQALRGKASWLGPGAITTDLSDEEIRKRVNAAIDDVPYAVGMNNHMGSKATADPRVMKIVLEVCKERGLFFLDSKTNYHSVTAELARQLETKYAENQLFLDDVHNMRHVLAQFRRINEYLADHDRCIAIGHVGKRGGVVTARAIQQSVEEMRPFVNFVPVSQIVE
jgi:hypothetical protein